MGATTKTTDAEIAARYDGEIDDVELAIKNQVTTLTAEQILVARRAFYRTGFALISFLLPEAVKVALSTEIRSLVTEVSTRHDVRFRQTSNTPRRMYNVGAEKVRERDGITVAVYNSPSFRNALEQVVGETVLTCPYGPEQYVITHLEESGDTHGWHWDDYSYGVVFVVDCPPVELGGFVQTVRDTRWDKDRPAVFRTLIDQPIHSHQLLPGDIYLLETDTTLHRVHPIDDGGRRTIVNMAYAAPRNLTRPITHETMEDLFRVGSTADRSGKETT